MTTGRAVMLDSLHAKRADLCSIQVDVGTAWERANEGLMVFSSDS